MQLNRCCTNSCWFAPGLIQTFSFAQPARAAAQISTVKVRILSPQDVAGGFFRNLRGKASRPLFSLEALFHKPVLPRQMPAIPSAL